MTDTRSIECGVRIDAQAFASRIHCPHCQHKRPVGRYYRERADRWTCHLCGHVQTSEQLRAAQEEKERAQPWERLGTSIDELCDAEEILREERDPRIG